MLVRVPGSDPVERRAVKSHLEAIRDVFDVLEGRHLVDIGCGESPLPRQLASLGAECTGVDPFMAALDWQAELSGRWRIKQSSAEVLPFADSTVDGVLLVFSLHHVPLAAQAAALREARRVLKPGGSLYVAEPLAEGDFHNVIKLFHDETRVRQQAQTSLEAARRLFARHMSTTYVSRRRFEDFAAFAGLMQANTRFNDYAAEDVVAPRVRACFEAIAATTRGVFDQPVKVDLLA